MQAIRDDRYPNLKERPKKKSTIVVTVGGDKLRIKGLIPRKDTKLQEMLCNQHFLEFLLNIAWTLLLFIRSLFKCDEKIIVTANDSFICCTKSSSSYQITNAHKFFIFIIPFE